MIVEPAPQRCPLCHQPSSEPPGPSRLCARCRMLVRTALPAVERRAAPVAAGERVEAFDAAPAPSFADHDYAAEPEEERLPSGFLPPLEAENEGAAMQPPAPFDWREETGNFADPNDAGAFVLEAEDESPRAFESAPPPVETEPEPEPVAMPYAASFADTSFADTPPQPVAPLAVASKDIPLSEPAGEAAQPAADQAVTDPWQEPLPAWEYSHNEWPLLVREEARPGRLKLWLGLAAVALAALAAAYFLFARPASEEPRPQPAASAPTELIKPGEGEPPPQSVEPSRPAETQAAEAAPAGEGNYTLQAVSVPSEEAARGYADRLRRAGIASYIVKADLGQRGTYYRVRIGRFATQAEAQSYAAQSRARARAAGFTLDFIVVGYEAPQ